MEKEQENRNEREKEKKKAVMRIAGQKSKHEADMAGGSVRRRRSDDRGKTDEMSGMTRCKV